MPTLDDIRVFAAAAISIFAIVDPVGSIPLLVSLTRNMGPAQRQKLVRLAGVAALAIVCVMAVCGDFLLSVVFQVGIDDFAFGGGLLLVVVGIRSLVERGGEEPAAPVEGSERRQLMMAVSPIACPLLVGPGAIVNTMLIVNQHGIVYALGACLTAFVFVILILNYAHVLLRVLGPVVTLAVGRIMSVFIVAIGVRLMFQAAVKLLPGLAG